MESDDPDREIVAKLMLVDRFNNPATMSYRDLKLSVVSADGFVSELQLHMDGFYQKKEELHKFYEQERVKTKQKSGLNISMNDETTRKLMLEVADAQANLDQAKKCKNWRVSSKPEN